MEAIIKAFGASLRTLMKAFYWADSKDTQDMLTNLAQNVEVIALRKTDFYITLGVSAVSGIIFGSFVGCCMKCCPCCCSCCKKTKYENLTSLSTPLISIKDQEVS